METYGYGFIFSLTGYLGVNVVLSLVKSFGALIAVTGMCLNSLHITEFINSVNLSKNSFYGRKCTSYCLFQLQHAEKR